MPLVTAQGYNLTPNITQQLLGGLQAGSAMQNLALNQMKLQALQQQQEKEKQIGEILGGIAQPAQQPTQQEQMLAQQTAEFAGVSPQAEAEQPRAILSQDELIAQAKRIDPKIAEEQLKSMGFDDESKRAEASRFAARMQSLPIEQQNEEILKRAEYLRSQGRDPKDTLQLLDMNQQQRDMAYNGIQMMDLSTKERIKLQQEAAAKIPKGQQVKSSDILPDGTTIQVMGDGSTRVTDPAGKVLTGEARSKAITDAQEYGVDIQQRRAQARGVGTMTSKKADELYTQIDKMRGNSDNLQSLIAEVKAGASSGPLINRLPTLTSATMRLENIKNRLGLDVVGSVTFGALSAKELELAQQTAVPDLPPKELVKWAEDKIAANEKLANYLSEQAAFLEQPGNTRGMWDDRVKQRKKEREAKTKETAVAPQQIGRFQVTVE